MNIKNTTKSLVTATAKEVASHLIGGTFLVSLIEEMQNGIYKDKLECWKDGVEQRLDNLEDDVKKGLANNDIFSSVLLISGQMALKTNKDKSVLLANAVANAATTQLSEERIVILLNCIERYTLQHIRLLRFLHNPLDYNPSESLASSPMSVYHKCCPDTDKDLDRIIAGDLYADGMIDTDPLNTTMTWQGCIAKRTTQLGDEMISFFGIEKS